MEWISTWCSNSSLMFFVFPFLLSLTAEQDRTEACPLLPSSPADDVYELSGENPVLLQNRIESRVLAWSDRYPDSLTSLIEYFEQNGFQIKELLADSRFEIYEGIGDRFRHSAERKSLSLDEYKNVLGFEDKRSRITGFINENNDQLTKAEADYDISRYVIAAIIGIESDFGKNIGRFNPFNAYVSMYAEGYRGDFARAQLEELLKFTTRNNIDVFELKSSYAGAMSFAQFIPYSVNKWFVGDDIFDMNNNILSVANYLAHFKEITGSLDGAVFRYNPSRLYTDAVLDLAKEAEDIYTAAR
ncbi:MAG: lytic murein transglycosylase [Balneolaceae bacterium]